jgi:hypothetical protein
VKEGHVTLIAAEEDKLITRFGPRIALGFEALAQAIHPGAF